MKDPKGKFYFNVILLPLAVAVVVLGLVLFLHFGEYVSLSDAIYGYSLPLAAFFFLSMRNNRDWLRLPDGSYRNIKNQPLRLSQASEPQRYEEEFFLSKKEQVITTLVGAAMMVGGAVVMVQMQKSILFPISSALVGAGLLHLGIKGFLDKTPKLKIAETGLWTNKLGFVSWDEISETRVVEENTGRAPQTVLYIYLKGTVFAEANRPDEALTLTDIAGKENVKEAIHRLSTR
jgi:hypothetical protein